MESLAHFEIVQLASSAVSLVVLVATALFVARQAREMSRQSSLIAESTRSAAFSAYAQQTTRLNDLFLEHAEVRPYFYDGRSHLDADSQLRQRILAMAEAVLDAFEIIAIHQQYFARVWPENTWEEYARLLFRSSPALREYLGDHYGMYPDELRALCSEALAKPAMTAPSPILEPAPVE
jgi:hypothetical protein